MKSDKKYISLELAQKLKAAGMRKKSKANLWILARDHVHGIPLDVSKVFFTRNLQEFENITQPEGQDYELSAYHVAGCPSVDKIKRWLWDSHKLWIDVSVCVVYGEIKFSVECRKVTNYCGSVYTLETWINSISGFGDPDDASIEMIKLVLESGLRS